MIAEAHPPNTAEPAGSTVVGLFRPDADTKASPPAPTAQVLDAESAEERYFELRDRSQLLAEQGRLEDALAALERALGVAQEIGDETLVATARCNVAGIAILLGRIDEHVGDLRSILMRGFDAETSYRAAYHLAHAYELQKEFKKSLFYSKIARDRAQAAGDELFVARSLNQIGNGLVGESHFQKAVRCYLESMGLLKKNQLEALGVPPTISCAYCMIVLGQVHDGMGQLFSALRQLQRSGASVIDEAWAHLFLCFGYSELGRYRRAWTHGFRAHELAETTGDYGAVKSALFLLGEVERCAGDFEASYEWFAEMQRRFYPDNPDMPQLLSCVGMTRVVNLRA